MANINKAGERFKVKEKVTIQREAQHTLSSGRGQGEGRFKQGKMHYLIPSY
jgi:hypothetical protein